MEDDTLVLLLNGDGNRKSNLNTPNHQKRQPLSNIEENDGQDSLVRMKCLNDEVPSAPNSHVKRHFDEIKLVRPTSATSQGSRPKLTDKNQLTNGTHLKAGGNRNSTDNLIQSSIDITLSSNSSPDEKKSKTHEIIKPKLLTPVPREDDIGIVTVFGAEDNENSDDDSKPIEIGDFHTTPQPKSKPTLTNRVRSTPDVQVSRFDRDSTTSQTAIARSQLAKRFLGKKAQQRAVPIQSLSNTTNGTQEFSMSNADQQQTSLAATVAASVAVTVAQPFIKMQNELEQKLNSMMEELKRQQERSASSGSIIPVTKVQDSLHPASKKTAIDDLVDSRMKQMEEMQEQQQQLLQKLVNMVHTNKNPSREFTNSNDEHRSPSPLPPSEYHFLDSLIGPSPATNTQHNKHDKKQNHRKKSSKSPSPGRKRLSRPVTANARTVKIRSPITFKKQPENSHFNIERDSPFECDVCDRSRSRSKSRSRSPGKGFSPDSSHPRPYAPVPRPPSMMSDGFLPPTEQHVVIPRNPGNALHETFAPFDKYINNSEAPLPLEPKPIRQPAENTDLQERIREIEEAKHLLDENYSTLQRHKVDMALLSNPNSDTDRIHRLVDQCVRQVTRQVHEEVKQKLEREELHEQEQRIVTNGKKRPISKTHLAFDRHSTVSSGKQTTTEPTSSGSNKPYSDAFMEAVYGRALYQKIKKEGKQPYFKMRNHAAQHAKQAKALEQVPVRDTGLKPPKIIPSVSHVVAPLDNTHISKPSRTSHIHSPRIDQPQRSMTPLSNIEPQYRNNSNGAVLLAPPQIRDVRHLQPTYDLPLSDRPSGKPSPRKSISSESSVKPAQLRRQTLEPTAWMPNSTKVSFGNKTENIRHYDDDDDNDDDDDDAGDGVGVVLPGYHGRSTIDRSDYDGPRFPPTIPHDEGYRNRQYDPLEENARNWVEQELIARFMSHLKDQQTTVRTQHPRDLISARSSTSSSSIDRSLHDGLLDLIGQDGFRVFMDVGQNVDQNVIEALTREVLKEQISQMIGTRSPRDSIQPPAPPPRSQTPTTARIPVTDYEDEYHPQNTVETPQNTRPSSPTTPTQIHKPTRITPEITAQSVSSDSEMSTPRAHLSEEETDRPLPRTQDHGIRTPDLSESPPTTHVRTPSPPPSPRRPVIDKRDASTMASIEVYVPPPKPVSPPPPPKPVSPPPPPPPPPPIVQPRQRTPSPVSSTTSESSTSVSSSSLTSLSGPLSSHDSVISDHMWLEDRSEGMVDVLGGDRPNTDLIMKQARRLLFENRRRRPFPNVAGSYIPRRDKHRAGTSHTLSSGEITPEHMPETLQELNDELNNDSIDDASH